MGKLIQPPQSPVPEVEISHLADHPEVLGDLAQGFKAQWPVYFADQPIAAIKMGFADRCRDEGLPLALVAMVGLSFAGTVTLSAESSTVCREFTPWLTHLYVDPAWRNRGIGRQLIRAVEDLAAGQGFTQLHAVTIRAAELFERCGWEVLQVAEHHGDTVTVVRKSLRVEPGN